MFIINVYRFLQVTRFEFYRLMTDLLTVGIRARLTVGIRARLTVGIRAHLTVGIRTV